MDGFLFVNKEKNLTSRQVCDLVGKKFHTKKVGHVGTLDPFATGLLIVSINKGTKAGTFFDDSDKRYVATICLGKRTDTLDTEGKVVEEKEVPNLTKEEIKKVLSSFLGKSKQIPPMTSAVHINGQKLYKLAHQGKEIDRPSREVEIFDIKLLSYENNLLKIDVKVSKGTYIRVLGSDIATKLGTCGYLTALERTEIGPFIIEKDSLIENISEKDIHPISEVLGAFSEVKKVDKKEENDIKNGKILTIDMKSGFNKLLIINSLNDAVAMYTRKSKNDKFSFARGLF